MSPTTSLPNTESKVVPAAFAFPVGAMFAASWIGAATLGVEQSTSLFREGGAGAFAVVFAAFLAGTVATMAVGLGLPRPLAWAAGVTPWIVGGVGQLWASTMVTSAVAHVSLMDMNVLLAAGTSEIQSLRILGTLASTGLLVGLGASFVMRTRRDGAGALVGAALSFATAGLALASLLEASALRAGLSALASVSLDGAPRAAVVAAASAEASAAPLVGLVLAGIAAVALVLATARAMWSDGSGVLVVVGVVAGVLLAGAGPALDRRVLAGLTDAASAVPPPWSAAMASATGPATASASTAGDFVPVQIDGANGGRDGFGGGVSESCDVVIATTGAIVSDAKVTELLRARGSDVAWGFAEGTFEARASRTLSVAIDARANGVEISKLIERARDARVGRVVLVGADSEVRPQLEGLHPVIAKLASGNLRSLFVSVKATEGGTCSSWWRVADRWSTEGALIDGAVWLVPGARQPGPATFGKPDERALACIDVQDDVTGATLVAAIENLRALGFESVALARPAPSDERSPELEQGLATLKLLGLPAPPADFGPIGTNVDGATILGSLDKNVIQRVVRSHLAAIKYCYERALVNDPALAGRVKVKWVIGVDGKVAQAQIESTTMNAPAVGECIVKQVKTWTFPQPTGGGIVIVNYPFIFSAP